MVLLTKSDGYSSVIYSQKAMVILTHSDLDKCSARASTHTKTGCTHIFWMDARITRID